MKPSGPTVLPGKGVATLDLADEHYPAWLRTIPDPPPVLYCNGSLEPGDRQAVAIVGSRQATPYGLRVTEALARELSALGFTIVSGVARGIDAAAHRAALEQGREVFAVPGPIDAPTSRGPHGLLKQGAKLVETVDDIVEELLPQLETMRTPLIDPLHLKSNGCPDFVATGAGRRRPFAPKPPDLSPEEQVVLRVIGREPRHIDDLTEQSRLPAAEVARILLGLELKALVHQLPGQQYCLKK